MPDQLNPVLVQFGVPPSSGSGGGAFHIDQTSGLAYRKNATIPLVEELIAGLVTLVQIGETFLTETRDNPDPDLVRADVGLVTMVTRTLDEPDPDLIRSSRINQNVFETTITRAIDDPDPDLIRQVPVVHYLSDSLSTFMTKANGDHPDPDLIRSGEF